MPCAAVMCKRICAAGFAVLFVIFSGIRLLLPLSAASYDDTVPEYAEELLLTVSGGDVQQWLDETLPEQIGRSTADWYAMLLSARGYDLSAYSAALQVYLDAEESSAAVNNERMALVLAACEAEPPAVCTVLLERSAGKLGIMSWIFALHLLNNGVPSEQYTAAEITDELLAQQTADGGWSLKGEQGDVDVTTMALQALAPYQDTAEISDAVSDGIAFLSAVQCPSGAYQSLGTENPESTAQVWTTLSVLGIDALTDDRFITDGHTLLDGILQFRTDDGRYSHTAGGDVNDMATMQVYEALTAAELQQSGRNLLLFRDQKPPQTDAVTETQAVSAETVIHTTAPSEAVQKNAEQYPYRIPLTIAAAAVFVVLAVICFVRKRRSPKTYLTISCGCAVVTALIWLIKIESPAQFYEQAAHSGGGTVTMEIRCDAICGMSGSERYPTDGTIIPLTEFSISEDETALELLYDAVKAYELQIEVDGVSGDTVNTAYVRGIASLYEFDFGDLSGWTYTVNGERPSVGCGSCPVQDGDRIVWYYTTEL